MAGRATARRWQNPKNAIDRSPLLDNGWAAFTAIRQQWVQNAPFRVRQIPPRLNAASSRKGSLESFLESFLVILWLDA